MSAAWYEGRLARDAMVRLTEAGITLRLADDGRIFAGPAGKLTPSLRQLISEHREGIALELSPPRERELRLQNHELTKKVNQIELDIIQERCKRLSFEVLADTYLQQLQLRQPAETIPTDIRQTMALLCHPDRHPHERQPAANKAMAWLNTQPRGES